MRPACVPWQVLFLKKCVEKLPQAVLPTEDWPARSRPLALPGVLVPPAQPRSLTPFKKEALFS